MHPAMPPYKNRSTSLMGLSLVPVMGDDVRVGAHLVLERGNLRVFDNDKANLGQLKETLARFGCNLNVRCLATVAKSKSLVFTNTEVDESIKFLTESQSSLSHKALKVYISSYGEEFPNKLDFINLISKELSIKKLDCEILIDELVDNSWLIFENETLKPGPRTVTELGLIEDIQ